ncbi:MAG: hypothetical protein EXR27_19990 [Betaproteobacteria bacterium]|nr:hypothetical protein [Betaproteobacteria bacterium]
MDRAIWISRYDLAEKDVAAYLDWAHGSYAPALLKRPGILWAAHMLCEGKSVPTPGRQHAPPGAVPPGYQYSLVVGGEDAHVFAKPLSGERDDAVTAADRDMLALRIGESRSVAVEQARVDGPLAGTRKPGEALSPCALLGSLNYAGDDEEMLTWFARVRFPVIRNLPGFIGMRKFVAVSGWAKHCMVYEFESVAAMQENYPKVMQDQSAESDAWNRQIMAKSMHGPGSPNVSRRLWSAVRTPA